MITKQDLLDAIDKLTKDMINGEWVHGWNDEYVHPAIALLLDRLPDADAEPADARGIRKGDAVYHAGNGGLGIAVVDAWYLAPGRYAVTALCPDGDHQTSYLWRKFDLPAEVRAVLFPTLTTEDDDA